MGTNVYFTRREQEVLFWVREGKTYPQIAEILGIAKQTVSFHMGNIMGKLEVHEKYSAVVKAARIGALEI